MYYFIVKDFTLNGSYEEPVYDDAPDLATYSINVHCRLKKGHIFDVDKRGNIDYKYTSGCYGVSVHEGILNLRCKNINLQKLITEGYILPISKEKERYASELEDWLDKYSDAQSNFNRQCEEIEFLEEFNNNSSNFPKRYALALGKRIETALFLKDCRENINFLERKLACVSM